MMFLAMLIILLLFMLFFSIKEEMTVECKYKYLGPKQKNKKLSDETINMFITIYNDITKDILTNISDRMTITIYNAWITGKLLGTEEIEFYIKNKSFPINQYVADELKNNTKIKFDYGINKSNISVGLPCRAIYGAFIYPSYKDIDTTNSQDVEVAKQIYLGEKPEPSCKLKEDSEKLKDICNAFN